VTATVSETIKRNAEHYAYDTLVRLWLECVTPSVAAIYAAELDKRDKCGKMPHRYDARYSRVW
jgi:hypothetical protein